MTNPDLDLDRLLGAASAPPEAPMDRFLASIPATGHVTVGLRRSALAGLLLAASLAIVAGGGVVTGLIPLPSQAPLGEPTSDGASMALSDDEAFAAALSGDLLVETYASEELATP